MPQPELSTNNTGWLENIPDDREWCSCSPESLIAKLEAALLDGDIDETDIINLLTDLKRK